MNLVLTRDVSGTGLPRMSAGADMERAEWDTGGQFDPQVSRRWRWGHLDRMLQGIVNSSFLLNSNVGLYGDVGLYLDSVCWFFRVKATTLVLEPAPGRFCRHFPEPTTRLRISSPESQQSQLSKSSFRNLASCYCFPALLKMRRLILCCAIKFGSSFYTHTLSLRVVLLNSYIAMSSDKKFRNVTRIVKQRAYHRTWMYIWNGITVTLVE